MSMEYVKYSRNESELFQELPRGYKIKRIILGQSYWWAWLYTDHSVAFIKEKI